MTKWFQLIVRTPVARNEELSAWLLGLAEVDVRLGGAEMVAGAFDLVSARTGGPLT